MLWLNDGLFFLQRLGQVTPMEAKELGATQKQKNKKG